MLILYILSICLAINTSFTNSHQVACSRFNSASFDLSNKLQPIEQLNLDSKDEELVRLEMIKQKILRVIGLKDPPQIDEKISNRIASRNS